MTSNQFAMSFPALDGGIVMQGHADYCAAHGHATHTVTDLDGSVTVSERCPRCGYLKATEEAAPEAAPEAALAATYTLVGENTLTGNTWECVSGIPTKAEAEELRKGWSRLESDYKISYYVQATK